MRRALAIIAIVAAFAGLLLAGTAAAQTLEPADVLIDQPEFIDSEVNTEDTPNGTIHHVEGDRFRIWLQNADHGAIDDWGISDGAGSLEYSTDRDHWIFEPEGNGTMELYWTADGGAARYEATLRIKRSNWVHQTTGEQQAVREDAEKWRDVQQEAGRVDPDSDSEAVISEALTYYEFFKSPFSTFFADIRGVLLMLILRPGGLAVLGIFIATFLVSSYGLLRYRNRAQKQLRDEHVLEEEKREIRIEKMKQIFQGWDWNDKFSDDTARALRDTLGQNPWVGFKQYLEVRSPTQTKGTILQLMGQVGYLGKVKRSDGGDVVEARVVHEDDGDDEFEEFETVDLGKLEYAEQDDRKIIDRIPGSDLDLNIFDQPQRLDPSEVSLPIDNRDLEDAELFAELQPRFPEDFEDEEHFAESLAKLMELVVNHPYYSDKDGFVDDGMDILSFMAEMDTVLADEADFPVASGNRRLLWWIADEMDQEAKLDKQISDLVDDGLGSQGA